MKSVNLKVEQSSKLFSLTTKRLKKKSLRDFTDYNKRYTITAIRILEGEEKESRAEKVLEEIKELGIPKFPKFYKRHKPTDLRSRPNSQKDKPKRNPHNDTS